MIMIHTIKEPNKKRVCEHWIVGNNGGQIKGGDHTRYGKFGDEGVEDLHEDEFESGDKCSKRTRCSERVRTRSRAIKSNFMACAILSFCLSAAGVIARLGPSSEE